MLTFASLNRRHKVGLFLVLVAAGLSLFFEASAKQTAGAELLGIAAVWFSGSLSLRILGFVFSTVLSVNPDEMTTRFLDPSSKSVKNWQRLQARKLKRWNSPA